MTDRAARIVSDPHIYGGKPIIRGRRLAVEHVLDQLAAGDDVDTVLRLWPWLEREDVFACLEYAARAVSGPSSERPPPQSS